jgi:hypothetical protein
MFTQPVWFLPRPHLFHNIGAVYHPKETKEACGIDQLCCAGLESGIEGAIHAIHVRPIKLKKNGISAH